MSEHHELQLRRWPAEQRRPLLDYSPAKILSIWHVSGGNTATTTFNGTTAAPDAESMVWRLRGSRRSALLHQRGNTSTTLNDTRTAPTSGRASGQPEGLHDRGPLRRRHRLQLGDAVHRGYPVDAVPSPGSNYVFSWLCADSKIVSNTATQLLFSDPRPKCLAWSGYALYLPHRPPMPRRRSQLPDESQISTRPTTLTARFSPTARTTWSSTPRGTDRKGAPDRWS